MKTLLILALLLPTPTWALCVPSGGGTICTDNGAPPPMTRKGTLAQPCDGGC